MVPTALRRATRRLMTLISRVRHDRGATGVEYALAVSVFVLAALGGIDHLESATEDEFENSATGIEGLPGNEGFGGGGAPTSPPPTTATTTTIFDGSPTTTAGGASTTTTQAPPPSTTATTTTPSTTVAHVSTITAVNDLSTTQGGRWTAAATVQVRDVVDDSAVSGAVVTVSMSAANGSAYSALCTTGQGGTCTASWPNRQNKHDPVIATVTHVDAAPDWEGGAMATTLHKP